ncbi:NUDIX domain-containing protein [Streptacidiphilus monticola]
MIIWVNGAFGAGKTTTVDALRELLPDAHVFDPETVGSALLREWLPAESGQGLRDFQDLVAWRRLVPEVIAALAAQLPGRSILVPMALLRQDYRDEIFGALSARRIPVHHVLLHADETVLRKRIEDDDADRDARQWRLDHLDAYRAALGWLRTDAAVVDTGELTPGQAARAVLDSVERGDALRRIVHSPDNQADTVAAAVLLFDEQDRPLLVDPVYKPGWEFPGGVVESGEAPSAAASRELAEELGLTFPADRLRLLLVDWEPHNGPRSGGLRLVFDGVGWRRSRLPR